MFGLKAHKGVSLNNKEFKIYGCPAIIRNQQHNPPCLRGMKGAVSINVMGNMICYETNTSPGQSGSAVCYA